MTQLPFSKNNKQPLPAAAPTAFAFLLLAGVGIEQVPASTALWAAPAILLSAMLIAWAAEAAQFFMAQGFALAILAWLQTLPEFAVEAVLAWHQEVPLLLANLTGALRLLTGLGWPMIYATAAFFYKRRHKKSMNQIDLEDEHCVEVIGLMVPLIYMFYVWYKASLDLVDAAVLIVMYVAYLWVLTKLPPQDAEGIEDLDRIPKAIVKSPPLLRNILIGSLFLGGGALIYFTAETFLGSLLAVSAMLGVPSFVFVQWVAPFVSEFPEKVSAFYWAKTVDKACMALMNMVSSNINQWTLLAAMLPIVYSISRGAPSAIPFNSEQELEIVMTLGQSLVGMVFLINMKMVWWEAASLFALWFIQFALSPFGGHIHLYITIVYFLWFGFGAIMFLTGKDDPKAFRLFGKLWREHVR